MDFDDQLSDSHEISVLITKFWYFGLEWPLFSYYGSIDTDSGDIGIEPVTRKWELKPQTLGVSREKQGPPPSSPIDFCILAFFHLKYDILYA